MIILAQILITTYYFDTLYGYTIFLGIWDSVMCNILQAACILGLWYPVRYYNNIKNVPVFILFHCTLFLISGLIWMGFGYFIVQNLIFSDTYFYAYFFTATLPVRIVVGLLIHTIFVLTYYLLQNNNELKAQRQNIEEKSTVITPVPVEKITRVIVKKNAEYHCVTVNQIRYIEANGDYVLIHTDSNKYLKDQTMKYWETHLSDDYFVRIHRSFIVNIEWIEKIELYEKETYKLQLKNGNSLKISSSGYKLLKQKMQL